MEDFQIIKLYWSRDEDAVRETAQKYGKLLGHISYQILSNYEDSEECVNDTYGRAWDSMPPQNPSNLAAYLGRITRNLSINRWHQNHAKKRDSGASVLLSELSDCIFAGQTPEEAIEGSILTEVIVRWLEALPKEDRVLFVRRYWYCDNLETLAREYLTTANKLAGRLFRMRVKLREALEQEGVTI